MRLFQDIFNWLHLHKESEQTYAGDLCALSIQQGLHGLDNQKKCHAGKYEQDSMEKQAPFKKARTGNPHVKVCKGSATCKETSL